jgi:hypothetical protein
MPLRCQVNFNTNKPSETPKPLFLTFFPLLVFLIPLFAVKNTLAVSSLRSGIRKSLKNPIQKTGTAKIKSRPLELG